MAYGSEAKFGASGAHDAMGTGSSNQHIESPCRLRWDRQLEAWRKSRTIN